MASKMKPEEVELSKEVEILCALIILEEPDVEDVRRVSSREDMYLHYDLIVQLTDGSEIRTDVKGLKSLGHGRRKTGEYHWIELKNVSGAPGWLFGKADVISFQVDEYEFIHIYRKDLLKFTEGILDNIGSRVPVRTDPIDFAERYVGTRVFTRDNPGLPNHIRRYDEVILVETQKLRNLAAKPFKIRK